MLVHALLRCTATALMMKQALPCLRGDEGEEGWGAIRGRGKGGWEAIKQQLCSVGPTHQAHLLTCDSALQYVTNAQQAEAAQQHAYILVCFGYTCIPLH